MALPTSLGATPEPFDNDEDSIALPKDNGNTVIIDGEAIPLDTVEDVHAISELVSKGDFVPSWKDAVVHNPNEKIIQEVAELAYKPVGTLTSEDVINKSYEDNYLRLEGPVQTLVEFVQKQLHDNNKLDDITKARAKEENKHEEMTRYLDQMILNFLARNPLTAQEDTKVLVAMVINEILGLGPIEPLWHDPKISEIMINGPEKVKIERDGKIITAKGVKFHSQKHLLDVCQQILGDIGRRIDVQHPMEDGRLRDMSRINVVHPAIAPGGPYVTIRRFPDTVFSMEKLVELKSMSEEMAVILGNLVNAGCSAVIVGGTGTGKDLSLLTKIPTPTGMTTMGELKVGDQVLDENGNVCNVTGYYPQPLNDCYEITFSDGTKVIAGRDHNWFTSTRQTRRAWSRQETDAKMLNAMRKPFATYEEIEVLNQLAVETGELIRPTDIVNKLPRLRTMIYNAAKTLEKHESSTNNKSFYLSEELFTEVLRRALNTRDQRHKSAVESVVTTKDIFDTLRTSSGHANHAIKVVSKAIPYEEKELKISPYAFGAWLGDGSSYNGSICGIDEEVFTNIVNEGNHIASRKEERSKLSTQPCHVVHFTGFNKALKSMNLTKGKKGEVTKFIPEEYLYSSVDQRMALVAGLLDTDGTVDKRTGCVSLSNTNKAIIDGFRQVLHSLGYQSTVTSRIPTYAHKGEKLKGQLAYTVSFFADDDFFGISRKADIHRAVRNEKQRGHRSDLRYIVDCQPVESVPTACITVDSPNHLFLCTDAFITTHNTSFLNALSGCISNDERILTVEDNLELRLHPDKDVLAMESRPAAASGTGGVSIRDIVKNTLRMRPDRIIVGEIRDYSAYDMLQVMNTGHDGSLTTVHADDSTGAVERLRNLVDEAGTFNSSTALTLIAGGVDLFVVIGRYEDGSRRVVGIYEVPRNVKHLKNGDIQLTPVPLWEFVHDSTDENGKVVGHYEKMNDISDSLITRKRLDKRKQLTAEEIFDLSRVVAPGEVKEIERKDWEEEENQENQ